MLPLQPTLAECLFLCLLSVCPSAVANARAPPLLASFSDPLNESVIVLGSSIPQQRLVVDGIVDNVPPVGMGRQIVVNNRTKRGSRRPNLRFIVSKPYFRYFYSQNWARFGLWISRGAGRFPPPPLSTPSLCGPSVNLRYFSRCFSSSRRLEVSLVKKRVRKSVAEMLGAVLTEPN
jgi:hypothetical protein